MQGIECAPVVGLVELSVLTLCVDSVGVILGSCLPVIGSGYTHNRAVGIRNLPRCCARIMPEPLLSSQATISVVPAARWPVSCFGLVQQAQAFARTTRFEFSELRIYMTRP